MDILMWATQNIYDYFITGLIGCMMFVLFIRKLKGLLNFAKGRNAFSSLHIFEVINTQQTQKACALLKSHCQDLSALGFDCEWTTVNNKQRPVALLQLASVHGLCCLFRLNMLCKIPEELQEILEDANIIKLGISPLTDSRLLFNDYSVQVSNTLDLRYLYPESGGLAGLAQSVIGVTLDKRWEIKCSNWEAFELTTSQKDYAAKDAFVAIEIFKKWLLTSSKAKLNDNVTLKKIDYNEIFKEDIKSEISRYFNIHFKEKHKTDPLKKSKKTNEAKNLNENKKTLKSVYATRKSPLYHNCFMHAPDGELLCSCDRRKAEWYVEKGLAEVLPGEPFSIKLLFEPAARGNQTNCERYYQQLKQNHCVVCGNQKSYLKHNVVPKEYRKLFPNIMKDHQSHDVVLMCVECHKLAVQHNEILKQKLAVMCNAPIKGSKITHSKSLTKIKNFAKALINAGDMIPLERKNIIENEVKRYFEVDCLTPNLLLKAASLETKNVNENFESHAIKVVNYFKHSDGGLIKLEILWREHFLKTMQPQYLPALWSVFHNHSKIEKLTEKEV